jgi:hypothetical protein
MAHGAPPPTKERECHPFTHFPDSRPEKALFTGHLFFTRLKIPVNKGVHNGIIGIQNYYPLMNTIFRFFAKLPIH